VAKNYFSKRKIFLAAFQKHYFVQALVIVIEKCIFKFNVD